MSAAVEGTQVPLSDLGGLTDWVAVKKVGGSMRVFGLHSFHASAVQQIKRRPRYQRNPE
jgi:hypothetical protein